MINYDYKKTYVLIDGDQKTWKSLCQGRRLYFYLDKIKAGDLIGFVYDFNEKVLYGQVNFAESVCLSGKEMVDFSKKYDFGSYAKAGRDEICAWAVESFINIQELYIEGLDDFGNESLLSEEEAKNFLALINENYLGQEDFEQEVKFLLDKESFEKIYKDFVADKNPKRQVNYYFDPSALVGDKSTTIRIREKDGKYTLTVKEKKSSAKDLSTEKSASVLEDDFNKIMADGFLKIEDYLENSLKGQVPFLGSLETIRDEVQYKNIALAFDKSSYFGQVDYEIEMEGRQDNILELRKALGLEDKDTNDLSKFGRFLRSLEEKGS